MSEKSFLEFEQVDLPHCCGVDVLGEFSAHIHGSFPENEPWKWYGYAKKPDYWSSQTTEDAREDYDRFEKERFNSNIFRSGTGYFIATFNEFQKAEYELFKERVNIVFQSVPKRNRNHNNNRVFVVVAEYKEPKKKKNKLPMMK